MSEFEINTYKAIVVTWTKKTLSLNQNSNKMAYEMPKNLRGLAYFVINLVKGRETMIFHFRHGVDIEKTEKIIRQKVSEYTRHVQADHRLTHDVNKGFYYLEEGEEDPLKPYCGISNEEEERELSKLRHNSGQAPGTIVKTTKEMVGKAVSIKTLDGVIFPIDDKVITGSKYWKEVIQKHIPGETQWVRHLFVGVPLEDSTKEAMAENRIKPGICGLHFFECITDALGWRDELILRGEVE